MPGIYSGRSIAPTEISPQPRLNSFPTSFAFIGERNPRLEKGSEDLMKEHFGKKFEKYADIPGLCKVASIKEIEAQGWSLNPGRYVGVAEGEEDDFDFKERLEELNEELEKLTVGARRLEERISEHIAKVIA